MYRKLGGSGAPVLLPCDGLPDPYLQCGCHPDVVGRLWDQIGAALPADCRSLVYGNLALVHPASGVILAVGSGTTYILRIPSWLISDVIGSGAKVGMEFIAGQEINLQQILGEGWVWGHFSPGEISWCRGAYEAFA